MMELTKDEIYKLIGIVDTHVQNILPHLTRAIEIGSVSKDTWLAYYDKWVALLDKLSKMAEETQGGER